MKKQKKLTHDEKVTKCEEFIKNFEDYDMMDVKPAYEQYGRRKYMIKLVTNLLKVSNNSQTKSYPHMRS